MACVRVGNYKTGKYGYIDKAGKIIINPIYTGAFPFKEGLACVSVSPITLGSLKDTKWQYIDKKGKIVIYKNSDFPVEFNNGLAFVSYDGIISYIDKTGKIVWSDSL